MGNEALSEDVDLSHVDYPAVQQSPEFQRLRRTHRRFVFPVLGACLAWYLVYVLLASYAHDFMSTPVFGSINVAMLMGLAQVVTTFAVTMWYVRFAGTHFDPQAERIRDEIETGVFEERSAAAAAQGVTR